jgi:hypothetical protein
MYSHGNQLFYKMDQGGHHKESHRRGHHTVPGDKHFVKVRMPYKYHNR